ncbi:hypothetical protein C2E23DRAFT_842335 [Lenzites betulinus]|nr:hypothetical protein C2E23DRAFT_842335 [Lenzites betulinus]
MPRRAALPSRVLRAFLPVFLSLPRGIVAVLLDSLAAARLPTQSRRSVARRCEKSSCATGPRRSRPRATASHALRHRPSYASKDGQCARRVITCCVV